MKTLVIQLDRTEDPGSIQDKVTWGKASRVLLVWPVNYAVFDRKIDLVTIKRICKSQGSRLGIVCDDPVVCKEAEELSIPVFESVNRAMRKGWDRRKRKMSALSIPDDFLQSVDIESLRVQKSGNGKGKPLAIGMRIAMLTAGVLSVMALVLVLLPSATVRVFPMAQTIEMNVEFQVQASPGGASNPGILRGEFVEIVVDGETSGPTTGTTYAPDKKARGAISITNRSDKDIELPGGTIVLNNAASPVRYQIIQDISVPAGGNVSGIEIEALYAGKEGNSDKNSITRIDGEPGLHLELTNPEPVSGGSEKSLPSPSTDDIRLLRETMEKKLQMEVERQLSSQLKSDEVLLPSSIHKTANKVEEIKPEVGQVGTTVKLSVKDEYSALVIHFSELQAQAKALLEANRIIPGWTITEREPLLVEITGQEYNHSAKMVKLQSHIKGLMIPIVDEYTLRRRITGTSRETAAAIIANQVLCDRTSVIESWPVWLPYLPWIESRITLVVR